MTITAPETRHAALLGLSVEEAALILTAFSRTFIELWQTDTAPTGYQVRHELKAALADNPRHEIYSAMALVAREDGGPHPDDMAHLEWCRRAAETVLGRRA